MCEEKKAYLYILCNDRKTVLYIGSTTELKKRIYLHKKRLIPGFTKKYNVTNLIYFEEFPNIEKAEKREKYLKGKLVSLKAGGKDIKSLTLRDQRDILALQRLGLKLLDQISYWLKTGKVAKNKIITLWKNVPCAIPKGKIGKPVEFGRKWIVNCYRGGYVLLTAPKNVKISDQNCVEKSLDLHLDTFQDGPKTYATDRGMWSEENICHCIMAGIEKIGIQPKGKSKSIVTQKDYKLLRNRRAGIEPRIGHLKNRGLGKSRMKSDIGDLISGYRAALSYNLTHLMRDLNLQKLGLT